MAAETDEAGPISQVTPIHGTSDPHTSSRNESGGKFRPIRYATEGDWGAHRIEITRLYMEEELPLKEVMHTMEEKHSFHASYGFNILPE